MTEPTTVSLLQELVSLGLIAAQPTAEPLPRGNSDRREPGTRNSWRVNLPDGRTARLVLGTRLADLAARQTAFARACPDLVPAPFFHRRLSQGEALAERFVSGTPLETVIRESPTTARTGFARLHAALVRTLHSSTDNARLAEWQSWASSIESLELWTAAEKSSLRSLLLPQLYPLLCAAPPTLRWSNGDFISRNILVESSGTPHLIDHEFSRETHFYTEDLARFHALSPAVRRWPELVPDSPPPCPAWHLFFWLRQLGLESAHNTPAYLDRVRPVRLGTIRLLAEQILGGRLSGWSVEPVPLHRAVEHTRWERPGGKTVRLSGWCYVPSARPCSFLATQGDHLLVQSAPLSRPDVRAHFAGPPAAESSGFDLTIRLHDSAAPLLLSALGEDGTLLPFHSLPVDQRPAHRPALDDYAQWALRSDPDPDSPEEEITGPVFSVLVPVYDTPPEFLRSCLESVRRQYYRRWELCLVDDGSSDAAVRDFLRRLAQGDPRIRLKVKPVNDGIAKATNDALAMAAGPFIVLLDHDDILRPHALLEFARHLRSSPDTDVLYSDEDKLSPDGKRDTPMFKPDFSPEFLLGVMYVGHALCVRTSLARKVGGFDGTYDGIQDYEFVLRLSEHTRKFAHLAKILYHWRQSPGSSALHGNVKGNMDNKQAQAVGAHLGRIGDPRQPVPLGGHRVRLVTTKSPAWHLIRGEEAAHPSRALKHAAQTVQTEILVLLMVEPVEASEHWVDELATLAARPDSGCVAPLLLSCGGTVYESGLTADGPFLIPLMRGFDAAGDGYNGSLVCNREVLSVSPLCLAVRRELILRCGPQDDTAWSDLCLSIAHHGCYHRICAAARLVLGLSWKTNRAQPAKGVTVDPYFNPHFDSRTADYRMGEPLLINNQPSRGTRCSDR